MNSILDFTNQENDNIVMRMFNNHFPQVNK